MAKNKYWYFWLDKSGRGFTTTFFSKKLMLQAFKGERSDNGQSISNWCMFAERGDRWENRANEITRIK